VTFKRYDGGAGPFEKHSPGSADGGHVGLWAAMDSVQLTYCCMRSCHLFEMRHYYAAHKVVVFVVHCGLVKSYGLATVGLVQKGFMH
jgi:hypothetical protein